MSAQLRSFLEFLRSPLRLWRRGRRLPARVQVTLLMAGGLSLAVALAVWTVARATPQEGASAADDAPQDDAAYSAALAEYQHGDKARGIALLEAFLQDFPESDQRLNALRTLDGAYEQSGDAAARLPVLALLVREYPESEFAPEAQIHIGDIWENQKDDAIAAAAYEEVARRWPASKLAPTALQAANRAWMRADQAYWATGQAPGDGGARKAPAIEANLERLLTDYADSPNAGAMLDVINYYVQPEWRTKHGVLQSQAQAVAWSERLLAQYPAAPESWPACRTLASLVQQQDPQRAAALIEAAIQQRPDAPEAPELQMQLADFRLGTKDYAAAAAAYEQIAQRWPESPLAPTALQNANRTRMQADQAFWATDQGPGAGGARNAPAIEANLERVLADYPDSPNGAGMVLDVISYYAQPEWWSSGGGPQSRAKVVALAERMIALYPDTALTCAARAGLAQAITGQDPQRAEALLDSSLEWAIKNNDHEHYVGLWFAKGEFYASIGQPAKSRAALEEVLRSEPTDQVAAEARLCIAYTYAREGRLADATRTFDELSQSATYTDDIRATAAYGKALELWAAGQDEAARQALAVVLSQFPDELSTADARQCQERWNQPRVRIIAAPGTREAK